MPENEWLEVSTFIYGDNNITGASTVGWFGGANPGMSFRIPANPVKNYGGVDYWPTGFRIAFVERCIAGSPATPLMIANVSLWMDPFSPTISEGSPYRIKHTDGVIDAINVLGNMPKNIYFDDMGFISEDVEDNSKYVRIGKKGLVSTKGSMYFEDNTQNSAFVPTVGFAVSQTQQSYLDSTARMGLISGLKKMGGSSPVDAIGSFSANKRGFFGLLDNFGLINSDSRIGMDEYGMTIRNASGHIMVRVGTIGGLPASAGGSIPAGAVGIWVGNWDPGTGTGTVQFDWGTHNL